jgi:hypothetical protein
MSIYYNPEMVRLVMEDRLREARPGRRGLCCADDKPAHAPRSLRNLFRRQSPAACTC